MCGGFAIHHLKDEKLEQTYYTLDKVLPKKNYNARPGQYLPIVVNVEGHWKVDRALWGIDTAFTKQPLINAQSEKLFISSFWRRYAKNRCLIPANGFFEWKKLAGKSSPFYFRVKGRELFYMAGVFTEREQNGYHFRAFTILTTSPNRVVSQVHTRMPVILGRRGENQWLSEKPDGLEALFKPFDPEKMSSYRVSMDVNNARNNSKDLIYPLKG